MYNNPIALMRLVGFLCLYMIFPEKKVCWLENNKL